MPKGATKNAVSHAHAGSASAALGARSQSGRPRAGGVSNMVTGEFVVCVVMVLRISRSSSGAGGGLRVVPDLNDALLHVGDGLGVHGLVLGFVEEDQVENFDAGVARRSLDVGDARVVA